MKWFVCSHAGIPNDGTASSLAAGVPGASALMDTIPPLLSSSGVQVSNKEGSSTAAADAADFDAAGTSSAGVVVQSDGPMGQEVAVQPAGQELAAQSADVRNIEEQPGEVQKVLLQLSASSAAFM